METRTFSWLHLTDFHFGLNGQGALWPNLRRPFFDDLIKLHRQTGPWQAVLFTGDLVQQGKAEEFKAMQQEVIAELWLELTKLNSGDAVLLAVPGNHDLFRPDPKKDNPPLNVLLLPGGFNSISQKFWDDSTISYRCVVRDAFAAYTEWWKGTPQRPTGIKEGLLPGDFSCTLNCGENRIGIIGLNTSFLQLSAGDYKERLIWDSRQLHEVCNGAVDKWVADHTLCLLLSHQGVDWLTPEARSHGESEIVPAGRFALHLFGHAHETKLEEIRRGGNPNATRILQGNSLFGMEFFGEPPKQERRHGYSAGTIEFGQTQTTLRIWPRIATHENGPWRFHPDHGQILEDDGGVAPMHLARRLPANTLPTKQSKTEATTDSFTKIAPHSTLPARKPFFGRNEELTNIFRFLQSDFKGWGVIIDGPGGIGKTALALEAAHRAPTERFPLKLFITAKTSQLAPDGEHALRGNHAKNYLELLTEIGLALGCDDIQCTAPEKRIEQVRHKLTSQRVLLVIDNLESFSGEERRYVYDLLEILPDGCKAIVTSRRRDETAARPIRLSKLDAPSARQMLAVLNERLCARKEAIAVLSADEQALLYTETDGNPLLLTWVTLQLGRPRGRCRTLKEALLRLHEAHSRQQENEKNDPLEFIFGDLLATFTNAERALLATLTFFIEPVYFAWLPSLAGLKSTDALSALEDLRDRALFVGNEANNTFILDPLCRRFLQQRLPEAIEKIGLRLKEQVLETLTNPTKLSLSDYYYHLEASWPLLRAAIPLAQVGENQYLQTICSKLKEFLDHSGRWNILLELCEVAESKALTAGDNARAGLRAFQAGYIYYKQNELKAVQDSAARCAKYQRANESNVRLQFLESHLDGLAYLLLENYHNAIVSFRKTLKLVSLTDINNGVMIVILTALATAMHHAGDKDGAKTNWQEALRLSEEIGNEYYSVSISTNLAGVYLSQGNFVVAEQLAKKSLEMERTAGCAELIGLCHHILAEVMRHDERRILEAQFHAREAVVMFTNLNSSALPGAKATLASLNIT